MSKFEELRVPDSERLASIQKLCDIQNPYAKSDENDQLFYSAMNEIISWHRERSPFYARLLEQSGFGDRQIGDIYHLPDIPFIHANFYKTHVVKSLPENEIAQVFTSSGTTGQKSQMFFDKWSIGAGRRMVDFVNDHFGFYSEQKTNYLISNYEPLAGTKHGATNTAKYFAKYAPMNEIFFALRSKGDGSHEFDTFGCIRKLKEYEEQGLPVRMVGFPSFMFFILERMKTLGEKNLQLHEDSAVMLMGGWKGYADKQIPKDEFYLRLNEQLGIPMHRIRDAYGSVEHSVPYFECEHHHKHVPIWSRMFVRDLKTLEIADYHQAGFANFVTPYLTSVPNVSVMMGDMVEMYHPEECPCSIKTPFFEILGRAGTSKSKSCAISAAELLKKEVSK
jgi:phenylacetate-coenzyme A ligase PaaK-like adenylate-forming protein